ncbi:asparagine synthetase B [Anaerolineae bacterium CFX8]|nr:asparagine synthetase B [Anaerolineae bacterium CFX8]
MVMIGQPPRHTLGPPLRTGRMCWRKTMNNNQNPHRSPLFPGICVYYSRTFLPLLHHKMRFSPFKAHFSPFLEHKRSEITDQFHRGIMSGLFGIIGKDSTIVQPFLKAASATISHRPWYVADTWSAETLPVGLGRSGIGIFNREPQPLASGDRRLIIFMSGELYNAADLRRSLGGQPADTDILLALHAFEQYGADFVKALDGAFFITIYDTAASRLILANDRFGLYPHYYAYREGQLAFAPEVKGVLCAPFVPRHLNFTAAAEYFRFQQVLGEKTFHEDIFLFPYGSIAQFDLSSRQWSLNRYWDWDQIPDRPEVTFEEAVIEVGRLLRSAVEKRAAGDLRPGVFLSGGLDSRALLGLMPPRPAPPVTASFGQHNSRDVYYAARIARAAGSRHHWFDLPDGRWVLENVNLHLKLTEGFHSWMHMHGITMLPALREIMDYNLTGWDGGTVMGHADHINPIYNKPIDQDTVLLETYKQFLSGYTWPGLADAEERLLYTDSFGKQAIGLAFDSMRQEFARFWNFRRHYAAEYFYITNHCWRSTGNMVKTARSHLEVRSPFWDYNLIDFMYSLQPEIRRDQLMYRHIITREMPKLALIPYDKKEYLPTINAWQHSLHALSVRARRRLRLFPNRPTLYADYENYLRGDLRAWAENLLYDRRTQERGLWNVAFVRSLMERHLAGHEPWTIGKIAPLITFEMVMREYFD